jgi:hypothetical protein
MYSKKGWLIGAAIGCLLITGFDRVEAKEIPYKGNFAGTTVSTHLDLNDDNRSAFLSTTEVSGTLGKRRQQGVVEPVSTGPTAECPGGVSIVDAQNGVGWGAATATFPNGDQLYFQTLTRTACTDALGRFTGSDTFSIVGGTGKFAGASGNGELSFAGFFQAFDANAVPPQGFGSVSGEFEGTLTLP